MYVTRHNFVYMYTCATYTSMYTVYFDRSKVQADHHIQCMVITEPPKNAHFLPAVNAMHQQIYAWKMERTQIQPQPECQETDSHAASHATIIGHLLLWLASDQPSPQALSRP